VKPIVAVVGRSGSGKTTLIERLIPELERRSLRVGAVKHTHHDFDLNARGKDSWHWQTSWLTTWATWTSSWWRAAAAEDRGRPLG